MEDLIELGLEAFDHVTDRYHDAIYDGVARVGPWVKDQRARSQGGVGRSKSTREKKKNTSDPSSPVAMPVGSSAGTALAARRDDGYDDGRGRNRDNRMRAPAIRIDAPPDDKDHIYPPAPQPMAPPYPTTAAGPGRGQLIAMPPDAPYPMQRSRSGYTRERQVHRDDYYDSEDSYDSYDERDRRHRSGGLRRSRSEYGPRRRSRSRRRTDDRNRRHDKDDKPKGLDKGHIAATITGAVAGGFLGKEASKGDLMATVAGALVGALGANVAEREWERHKRKDAKVEQNWESKWGYRS